MPYRWENILIGIGVLFDCWWPAARKLALVVVAIVVPAVVYAPGWLAALLYLATSVCIDMCVTISRVEATQKQDQQQAS